MKMQDPVLIKLGLLGFVSISEGITPGELFDIATWQQTVRIDGIEALSDKTVERINAIFDRFYETL